MARDADSFFCLGSNALLIRFAYSSSGPMTSLAQRRVPLGLDEVDLETRNLPGQE